MNFAQDAHNPLRRFGGLGVAAVLHALLAYALITNLSQTTLNILRAPVETRIIEETKPPPPPDTLNVPPPPAAQAPPPPYMPPPEVKIQTPPPVNTISAITSVPPPAPEPFTKTVVAPPAAVAQPLKVTISKPAPPPPVPAFADLNACKPEYPRTALLAEEEGTVRVQFAIGSDGLLVSAKVLKSSGYSDLDKAAIHGLSRCLFRAAMKDGKPVQSSFTSDYVWKLDQ